MIRTKPERRTTPADRFLLELSAELPQPTILARWQDVNAVLRIGMMSGLQMQLDATLTLLCDTCAEITPYRLGLAYFYDAKLERSILRLLCDKSGAKSSPADQQQLRERLHTANLLDLWGRIHRKPVRVRRGDSQEVDEIFAIIGGEAVVALPLFVNGRVMGSLQLVSDDREAFSQEDVQLLWVLLHVAENLLTREHANESLMMFAFTDHLTGLRTRGYFEQQLELEIKRSARKAEAFALLMLDIDNFKTLNDTYGHGIGDQVLREIAAVLTEDMREVDTVARYGGEEFVIILPETTEPEGFAVAERIRNAVAERTFLRGPEMSGIAPLRLTISIGIANFPADSHDKKDLMGLADAALYAAKSQGRNRVVTHGVVIESAAPVAPIAPARKEAV